MRPALLEILADPVSKSPLHLEPAESADADVENGRLVGDAGRSYVVRHGIPRFVLTDDEDQLQTQRSFGFKWKQRHTYDSKTALAAMCAWQVERYGYGSEAEMREYFTSRRRILDAGCGSGFSSSIWMDARWREQGNSEWVGMDISEAIDVAHERLGHIDGMHFVQGDILEPPFQKGAFDTIFSEGVMHHTPSTRQAIASLTPCLQPGGHMLFYVYRKKGPLREFTDDHVRHLISDMPEEQAWEFLKPLTRLGQALAELQVEVDVPEDIPWLGIKAGRQDVQRLVYWNFAKLFWNPNYTFDENHHINFDWYHPRYAHRHTEEELRLWCSESGLSVHHFCEQDSGYTVVAVKE